MTKTKLNEVKRIVRRVVNNWTLAKLIDVWNDSNVIYVTIAKDHHIHTYQFMNGLYDTRIIYGMVYENKYCISSLAENIYDEIAPVLNWDSALISYGELEKELKQK